MSFGGGGGTNSNDVELARQEQAAKEAEAARVAAAEQARKDEEAAKLRSWEGDLDSAYSGALTDAEAYFYDMGVDPTQYMDDISRAAQQAKGRTPELSTDIQSYFDNLGQSLYDDLTTRERAKAGRGFDDFARTGFAKELISDTADDATINAILGEQRQNAVADLDTLLARGILTDTGYSGALKSLDDQSFGAKSTIEELTSALLQGGRADLRDIASTGRSAAESKLLGEDFDARSYERDINQAVTDFFSSLGDKARGGITGDLFDISSAYQQGGSAQGAGNTGYDLNAALGAYDSVDKKKDEEDSLDNWFSQF